MDAFGKMHNSLDLAPIIAHLNNPDPNNSELVVKRIRTAHGSSVNLRVVLKHEVLHSPSKLNVPFDFDSLLEKNVGSVTGLAEA